MIPMGESSRPGLQLLDEGPSLAVGIKGIQPATGAKAEAMEELVDHQAWDLGG